MSWLVDFYPWLKALHVFAAFAWMAGMFYLPRLYVYHCQVPPGSDEARRFEVMEARLLGAIMRPAMGAVWVLGIVLLGIEPGWLSDGWIYVKLLAVVGMTTLHEFLSAWRRDFLAGGTRRPERFYRRINEVPTVLLLIIVAMVIVKPF